MYHLVLYLWVWPCSCPAIEPWGPTILPPKQTFIPGLGRHEYKADKFLTVRYRYCDRSVYSPYYRTRVLRVRLGKTCIAATVLCVGRLSRFPYYPLSFKKSAYLAFCGGWRVLSCVVLFQVLLEMIFPGKSIVTYTSTPSVRTILELRVMNCTHMTLKIGGTAKSCACSSSAVWNQATIQFGMSIYRTVYQRCLTEQFD
jgi:hypothetical protein